MPLLPIVSTAPGDICHDDVTVPVEAACKSCPACRDPARLLCVAAALEVETNPRYTPRDTSGNGKTDTHCDRYVGDLADAMCVILPQSWHGKELSANGTIDWLWNFGKGYGWTRVTAHEARAFANVGDLVLVAWRNPAGSGHLAAVMPSEDDGPLLISQAGKSNLHLVPIGRGFGDRSVEFWAHN